MKTLKFSLLLFVLFLTSCNDYSPNHNRLVSKLPDSEIAYYLQSNDNEGKIGFINSDGSNNTEIVVRYKKGLLFDDNFLKYDVIINSPPFAWNRSLRTLGLLKNSSIRIGAGYPLLINEQGKVFECPIQTSPWTTKNFIIQENLKIILIDEKDLNNVELVIFNMQSCQKEKILHKASNNESILSFSISSDNKIAISKQISNNDTIIYKTELVNNLQNYHSIDDAIAFHWGENGKRFFYYDLSKEETVICEDIDISCKVGIEKMYAASWSTDENWLIYEDGGKIYKKDVNNQSVKFIVDGYDPISQR